MINHRYWVVIPAAGIGSRMQITIPKQYLEMGEKTMLAHVIDCFLQSTLFQKIVVVIQAQDSYWPALGYQYNPRVLVAHGAEQRCQSVLNGLIALQDMAASNDWVLVHDAARPYVLLSDIEKLIQQVGDHAVGGILGMPITDTVKKVQQGHIVATLNRAELWRAATPQMFRYGALQKALTQCIHNKQFPTDEASAMEALGLMPLIVECSKNNIKITTKDDLKCE